MRRRLGLVLAVVLLGAAMLPASASAAPNLGHQGTKTAPVTVHCWWDANAGLYDVLWTVSPDVLVQMSDSQFSEGDFLIWAAASGKYSAPSVFLDDTLGFDPFVTYYSWYDIPAFEWPNGYITVQAVGFSIFGTQVIASGTAKCQRGDIGSGI